MLKLREGSLRALVSEVHPCHRTALHIITTGEASTAASYREVAGEIVEAARGHYNGEYIYECHGREKDGAVIHAIITFGE